MRKHPLTFVAAFFALFLMLLAAGGCAGEPGAGPIAAETAVETTPPSHTATAESAAPLPTPSPQAPDPTVTTVPTPTIESETPPAVPPFYFRDVVACGRLLPIMTPYDGPLVTSLTPDAAALEAVLETLPPEALPALEQLLQEPQTAGLAAYRVGQEENGVFLNADVPLPLASVVKVIHLIAYAEAVSDGELSPTDTIFVDDLDRYYYRLDQRAHLNALEGLEEDGRVFGQPPAMILDEVAHMMIEYSSNAATDYLHMTLGQERVEQTAQALEMQSQNAPCPFVGQFLIMANPTRPQVAEQDALQFYSDDSQRYGEDVMQLTAAFSEDAGFHDEALEWRRNNRRPDLFTQRAFSEQFNARGSAADYAGLMARVALNGLSSDESSFLVRRHLEWPMRFPENQALFSNLAYKGGTLPGIITTVYYAYPIGDTTPIVVALFYHDLHNTTYQQWRRSLAHDEFARWMLYEPAAIPALRELLAAQE